MKKVIFSLVLVSLFSFSSVSQTKKRPVAPLGTVNIKAPKVILKVPPKTYESQPKTLGITVEKYVVNHDVNADGTSVETYEMQQRFNSDLVIESYKKFERAFNGDLQKAEVLEAYILKADGKKVELPSEDIQIKPTPQAEAAPSFSSLKEIQINYKDLKNGDATYFKYRLTTTKPYFENQFDMIEVLPFFYEWKSVEINLTAPKDFQLYIQSVDFDGGRIADENGKARWQWHKQNQAAFEIESGMYDYFNASPRLAVTSFKNFEELGAAYWSEAKKKAVVTPEIQTLADEITKDIKEPQQQASAIYEWANKNIRYLSIVLDKGGWIPHSSSEILANRYGDCKDYSTILYTLLKAKNIDSYPVLIRSEFGDWFPEVATPDYFNHAILYIPSLKLFADATAPNSRLGLITQTIVGKKAILAGEKTGVIETPRDNPADNQILSDVEINFAPNGSLKAVSKNIYDGRSEIIFRPLFADSKIQNNSENFVKLLLAYYGIDGSGKLLKVGNPFKVGEPFTVEMQVEVPNFTTFTPSGSILLPIAVNMINITALEQFIKTEQRKTNLILGATRFRENFKLNFPEGVKIQKLPPVVNFSNSIGSYRNEFTIDGNSVRVIRELVVNKDVISAAAYSQIRELINKSVAGNNVEIHYSANPNFARQKSLELRKNPVKSKPVSISEVMLNGLDEKPLNAVQAAQFEAKIKNTPDDIETRKRLLRFYNNREIKDTPSRRANRLNHRLWFVQNRPEINQSDLYGYLLPKDSVKDSEYQTVRDEWLKQIEANKNNPRIRLNAVNFVRYEEPDQAEKLLTDGRKIDRDNFEFPLILSELLNSIAEKTGKDGLPSDKTEYIEKKKELFTKAFESGEVALVLLKKERTYDRDVKRGKLLQTLAKIAFELKNYDRAKSLATELILDYGQDAGDYSYDDATHIGNIILGRIALSENNLAKAKEYLLIAIRAPLRKDKNNLAKIDTALAKEIFQKGEKETVSEYFKLCENLWSLKNYTTLYADEIKALKLWQEEIKQGKTPTFDFEKP
jgi:Domain of Unknown Function with PDB structure (DUF3857)/Domain of Unknown Function with PDB structure (DUF3858)/Transglutaminase-like superfamily